MELREQKRGDLRRLYIPAVFCAALWGSAAPCIKMGYGLFGIAAGDAASQLVFAGLRFVLAGLLVLCVAALRGRQIVPRRDQWGAIASISLFQTIIQYPCYYIGLSATSGVNGSVLSGTQTFFAVLLAHALLRDDKLSGRKVIGCVLGFAGVSVLGGGRLDGFGGGDLLVLLSAVSAGAGALVSRMVTPGRDPMLLTGWQLAGGGALLTAIGFAGGGSLEAGSPAGLLLLCYLALLSSIAFTVWTALLGKFPVSRVTLFSFCIPVFGALFSALLLSEHVLTLRNFAALACISGGIAVASYAKGTKREQNMT